MGKKEVEGCTCQSLAVEKPAAALGPTQQHCCYDNKKIHWSHTILRSNCCAKVSELRVLLDGGDIDGMPVQCPHGKSQVQSDHPLCSWSNTTFLGKNNTLEKSDGWGWMRSSTDMQAAVLHTCRSIPSLNLGIMHSCAISPSSSLPHRLWGKICRDSRAPGCSFIWGFLLTLFFSSTTEFADPISDVPPQSFCILASWSVSWPTSEGSATHQHNMIIKESQILPVVGFVSFITELSLLALENPKCSVIFLSRKCFQYWCCIDI